MGASQGGGEGGREGGRGFPRARSTPLRLHREEKLRVTAVAAGYAHTTLLSADGLVFVWASQDSSLRCKQVREGGQEGGRLQLAGSPVALRCQQAATHVLELAHTHACARALGAVQPLLEQLLAEFQRQYPEVDFPPLPPKGELDLNQLREATYFFS